MKLCRNGYAEHQDAFWCCVVWGSALLLVLTRRRLLMPPVLVVVLCGSADGLLCRGVGHQDH